MYSKAVPYFLPYLLERTHQKMVWWLPGLILLWFAYYHLVWSYNANNISIIPIPKDPLGFAFNLLGISFFCISVVPNVMINELDFGLWGNVECGRTLHLIIRPLSLGWFFLLFIVPFVIICMLSSSASISCLSSKITTNNNGQNLSRVSVNFSECLVTFPYILTFHSVWKYFRV